DPGAAAHCRRNCEERCAACRGGRARASAICACPVQRSVCGNGQARAGIAAIKDEARVTGNLAQEATLRTWQPCTCATLACRDGACPVSFRGRDAASRVYKESES